MKKNLLFSLFAGCALTASATTYHVDAAAGCDTADGLTPATAVRTLARVNKLNLAPGDRVLFRRGGLWRGQLRPKSGAPGAPVLYGAYGDGAKPILQGSVDRSRPEDWIAVGDNVWATRPPRPPAVKERIWDGAALKAAWGFSYQEGNRGRSWTQEEAGVRFVRVTLEKKVRAAAHLLQLWGPKVGNLPDAAVLRLRVRSTKPFSLSSARLQLSLNRPPWTSVLTPPSGLKSGAVGTDWSVVEIPLGRASDLADGYLHFSIGDVMPEGAVFDFVPLGLWRVEEDRAAAIPVDVGIFICNHGERWGVKKWDNPDWQVPPNSKWVRTVTKDRDLDFWHNPTEQRVYVRYPSNPGAAFDSIELALTRHIVDEGGCHDVTYDGLHLRYGAAHGIGGGATANITVRNCDICWIGGGLQYWNKDPATGRPRWPTRYGNGIEFWAGCGHNLVERNRLWQIYDAALTNQTKDSPAPETDIVWRDNIVWQAEYSFEYWNHDPSSLTANILFDHNTCGDPGGCWSHDQRPDPNGAHLMFYDNAAPTTNFVVRNNLFVGTTDRSTRFFNDWRVKHPAAADGLVMTNNLYWIPANKIAEYHVNGRETREGRAGVPVRLEPGSWGAGEAEFRRYQQEFGLDAGSLYAEPQFVDAANHDYRLKPTSPGFGLGARVDD